MEEKDSIQDSRTKDTANSKKSTRSKRSSAKKEEIAQTVKNINRQVEETEAKTDTSKKPEVKVTDLPLNDSDDSSETKHEKKTRDRGYFWHNFTKLFTPAKNENDEDSNEESASIQAPEGKSLIDDFENQNIDSAVINTLKKRRINISLKSKKKANNASSISQALIDKIEKTERFNPKLDEGLTEKEVKQRQDQGLVNKTKKKYSKTYWEIIRDNVFTFFNVILTAIAIALICVNRIKDCTFLVIMVINIIVGLVQEIKSKKTIDKLHLITAPSTYVLRDGIKKKINIDELVIDDIIIVSTGNQISADSIVLEGNIEVNESLLTGESLPIKKNIGDTIYAGSFVVSGTAKAKINRIAEANWAISLQTRAKQFSKPKSELLRSMNAIIRVISVIVLPVAGAMFAVNWLNSTTTDQVSRISSAVGTTAGVVVGMVPAGMFLLVSVALAAGVIRLSKQKTLVQDLYCFEMLARTNVLCLDKTGTLTDGTMDVTEVVVLSRRYDIDRLMGSYLNSFTESNQTSLALASRYALNSDYKCLASLPFSSSRKYAATTLKDIGTLVLGAPEFVYKGNDKTLASAIEDRQKKGYRVVMLVRTSAPINGESVDLSSSLPLALFILTDHIREEAYNTIKWFQDNDVECKIISGDNPFTAAEIAKACGVNNTDRAISLEGLSLKEVADIADKYTVFGRVSPEQKATLVKALKTSGKTVSMTGDGVNDILAMKQADCSIAMASGADAPRNIAHLVLLDSNFASMPAVVMEGRRVVNNIQRSSALFLMKTIFTITLSIIFIITGFSTIGGAKLVYPFTPSDLLLMEFVGIGVPSFFLSLQPNKNRIKGGFLLNTFKNAIPGAIVLLVIFWSLFIMAQTGVFGNNLLNMPISYRSTSMKALFAICLTFGSLGMLYSLARPFNTYRVVLFVSDLILMILIILLFNDTVLHIQIFGAINVFPAEDNLRYALNKEEILTLFIFAFASPVLSSLLMAIFNHQSKDEKESLKIVSDENMTNRKE
ncbi:MAG TPA: ATPase P [Firmicutes bacterium]|nr:ATPase P [Bacillota bacterium]